MFKPLISRYRLHGHSLNIETGRYYNIDRHARIPKFISCPAIRIIRDSRFEIRDSISEIRNSRFEIQYLKHPIKRKLLN
jgi:hypothetical protein